MATIEPRKNLPRLIQAFLNFQKNTKTDIYLVLVGRENKKIFQKEKINLKDKRIVLIERVISVREKKWLYQKALGFIYVSLLEGFGLPLVEAMSQGCPLIYSNTSSLQEIGQGVGMAVNPTSITEIEAAMSLLSKDLSLRKKLSKKGLQKASFFSWDQAGKEVCGLII